MSLAKLCISNDAHKLRKSHQRIIMFDKVSQLQRPPFHPKWKEMAPRATVSGWTRFKAAQEWLDRNMSPSGEGLPQSPTFIRVAVVKKR